MILSNGVNARALLDTPWCSGGLVGMHLSYVMDSRFLLVILLLVCLDVLSHVTAEQISYISPVQINI